MTSIYNHENFAVRVDRDTSSERALNDDGMGTGFSDRVQNYFWTWSAGNRGVLSGNPFEILDAELSRTPSDVLAWGAVRSTKGRK